MERSKSVQLSKNSRTVSHFIDEEQLCSSDSGSLSC
uniref:Uncharacterized protein n=1 Tax=Human betaherpesvirus 6 TaxID=10368 RepID=A0A5P9S5E7_9BETA|nr:hypothetical protein [Human betaherpesvirus 6]QFV47800.1 hypothetical protein [Human betaherpesvirus 6]QFV49802.1 hypothetical protein [Human betaherpesvirus 6]QFW66637.1 hypothetical protein [Human betaherpesvirus 6]QFX16116.1 hypothetical protein [Human betaherpesvirus 6]